VVQDMRTIEALKLIGYGVVIAFIDLAIEAVDANASFVKTVKSIL